ncbi:non-specific lipid transfer protein GPI-anchored 16-like [Pyrus communis]|uniref:non-specific lipid transfer protein GPI-anchored 16-like n=1 Tax=Pyrus communis TaxID=23211 RepID=UPI0035BEB721
MESFKDCRLSLIPITLLIISQRLVNGQISTPCTASMISSVTPCVNYITGSTSNGGSPTAGCCSLLKSLMGTGMDCACLLITGGVPVQLPINRTLALSLPRACKMGGVPLQCKASGSPLPAPGPSLLGPTRPPTASSPLSPRASKAVASGPAPESGTSDDLQPASPSDESEAPTQSTQGIGRPQLTPSASSLSYVSPPSVLLIMLGIMVFNSY